MIAVAPCAMLRSANWRASSASRATTESFGYGVGPAHRRAGGVDARALQAVLPHGRAKTLEELVPLARVPERGDAVCELVQRQLRVGGSILDVEMRVYQAWQDRASGEIHVLGPGRCRHLVHRSRRRDPIPFDDNPRVGKRRPSRTIDEPDVIEDQDPPRSLDECRYQYQPANHGAHRLCKICK